MTELSRPPLGSADTEVRGTQAGLLKAYLYTLAVVVLLLALSTAIVTAQIVPGSSTPDPKGARLGEPTAGEVPLPAAFGWNAFLVYRTDVGIWSVQCMQVRPEHGCPEVVGCDDKGRLTILTSYSGKWTPQVALQDGQWLAAVAHADVDPVVEGPEIYAGGKGGTLYQVVPEPKGRYRSRAIWHALDDQIHTVVAGDLRPGKPGDELWVFTLGGTLWELDAPSPGEADQLAPFRARRMARLGGRVRDALFVHGVVYTVSRSGELTRIRATPGNGAGEVEVTVLAREPMGLGRITSDPSGHILYVARDDGLILRFVTANDGGVFREPVYAGPSGPRGLVSGRFDPDPTVETLAVYGYEKSVQMLKRKKGAGPFKVENIFVDEDAGHWLAKGELDGRNQTEELLLSGFGGRIVMLTRPPGDGLEDIAFHKTTAAQTTGGAEHTVQRSPSPAQSSGSGPRGTAQRPWRVAVKGSELAATELSTLRYQGGFETKTMVYETLVQRAGDGRLMPGLASAWTVADDGRRFDLTLRPGARFHDGQLVTPAAVAEHFRRFVGLPEHDWLTSNRRIQSVTAVDPQTVSFLLDRPHALLPDLCAINPTGVRAPSTLDREGNFVRPVGSGPFRFVGVADQGRLLRFERIEGAPVVVDLLRLQARDLEDDPLEVVLRGDADMAMESWLVKIDRSRLSAVAARPDLRIVEAPGSSMSYLSFLGRGPTADLELRRAIAHAIDREALIRDVEQGHADASQRWAAPSITTWPDGPGIARPGKNIVLDTPLKLLVGADPDARRLGAALCAQLTANGLPTEMISLERGAAARRVASGGYDLRLEVTHGLPYDPHTTLVSRCTPPPPRPNAESPRFFGVDPMLAELVGKAAATPDEQDRLRLYAAVQNRMDEVAQFVPLYAKRRLGVVPATLTGVKFAADMYRLDLSFLTVETPP